MNKDELIQLPYTVKLSPHWEGEASHEFTLGAPVLLLDMGLDSTGSDCLSLKDAYVGVREDALGVCRKNEESCPYFIPVDNSQRNQMTWRLKGLVGPVWQSSSPHVMLRLGDCSMANCCLQDAPREEIANQTCPLLRVFFWRMRCDSYWEILKKLLLFFLRSEWTPRQRNGLCPGKGLNIFKNLYCGNNCN